MVQSKHTARVRTKEALSVMASLGAITSVLVLPGTAQLLDEYMKHMDKKSAGKTLSHLKYRKLIKVRELDDGYLEFTLTSKAKNKFARLQLDDMSIKVPFNWDKKWRMVMFDIPSGTNNDNKRHYFVEKLKSLQFYMLQKSVWIHPFDCETEIGQLLEVYGLHEHVSYVVAESGNFTNTAEIHFQKIGLLG